MHKHPPRETSEKGNIRQRPGKAVKRGKGKEANAESDYRRTDQRGTPSLQVLEWNHSYQRGGGKKLRRRGGGGRDQNPKKEGRKEPKKKVRKCGGRLDIKNISR